MPTNSVTVTAASEEWRRSDSDPRTATATHALALVLEAMVDRLVSERLDATLAARAPATPARPGRWMTAPAASRETGVPVRTIRAWAHEGRPEARHEPERGSEAGEVQGERRRGRRRRRAASGRAGYRLHGPRGAGAAHPREAGE